MVEDLELEMMEHMETTINVFKKELAGIRTGRANPALLDYIKVDYYGTQTPLNQMSNLTVPDSRTIVIRPYDKNCIGEIEKAIMKSDLGITPNNNGTQVILQIPELTEERRKELVRLIKKLAEDSRTAIRNVRRDFNDRVKKLEANKELSEDQMHDNLSDIQEHTDESIKQIDEIVNAKEKEIMEV